MILLTPPTRDDLADYNDVVTARDDPPSQLLLAMANRIDTAYADYKNGLSRLHQLEKLNVTDTERDALYSNYNSNSKYIGALRREIRLAQTGLGRSLCQYCGLNTPSTLDHFAPRAEFPEFAILSVNLVPCCPRCNNAKKQWLANGACSTINFYHDSFLLHRFLRCTIGFDVAINDLTCLFELKFAGAMTVRQRRVVANHYAELGLLEIYQEKVAAEVAELLCQVKILDFVRFDDALADIFTETAKEQERLGGVNYWRAAFFRGMSRVKSATLRNAIHARYLA